MDIVAISDLVVVVAGLIIPFTFLPQIIRVTKLKDSTAISVWFLSLSFFIQATIFANAYLHGQWQIMLTMVLSMVPLSILIFLTLRYRKR